MEDMMRQSHGSTKQFIVGNFTQLVERQQVHPAVYPWRRARSSTESMRLRSEASVNK